MKFHFFAMHSHKTNNQNQSKFLQNIFTASSASSFLQPWIELHGAWIYRRSALLEFSKIYIGNMITS